MKRATVTINRDLAFHSGEDRHPQVVVREFCHRHDVRVTNAVYASRDGTWTFEVETDARDLPLFPDHIIARPHK